MHECSLCTNVCASMVCLYICVSFRPLREILCNTDILLAQAEGDKQTGKERQIQRKREREKREREERERERERKREREEREKRERESTKWGPLTLKMRHARVWVYQDTAFGAEPGSLGA